LTQQGYIKLYRKTMCSPIWQDPHYLKLWMYCLMKASHKEHKQLVGNQIVILQPGDFITGRTALSDDLNKGMKPAQKLNELSWWRHLDNLEKWEMLNIKKTNKYSVISIVKWVDYQEAEQQLNNNRTSNEQQLNTNKNVKNVKNEKEEIPFKEIISYLNEKSGSNFKHSAEGNKKEIRARWNEKFRLEDFKNVIDYCCGEWKGKTFSNGKQGDEYLKPSTLFNNKFDERLNKTKLEKQPSNYVETKPKLFDPNSLMED
jgi:uncharacterized phage protein (TIGR02220 family)